MTNSLIYILFAFPEVFGTLIVLTVSSNVYILFGLHKVFGAYIVVNVSSNVLSSLVFIKCLVLL